MMAPLDSLHGSLVIPFTISIVKVSASSSKVFPKDEEAPAGGFEDMTKLPYLHEPGVLHNLEIRYQMNKIYVR